MNGRLRLKWMLAVAALSACTPRPDDTRSDAPAPGGTPSAPNTYSTTIAIPMVAEPVKVTYEVRNGQAFMEDDILLGPVDATGRLVPQAPDPNRQPHIPGTNLGSTSSALTAAVGNYWRWPDGIIPYDFADGDFTPAEQTIIANAVASLDALTNLSLPRRQGERNYVRFYATTDDGCGHAHVGMVGEEHGVYLNFTETRCTVAGRIQHEVLHAASIFHEQSRNDRDAFVKIFIDNVKDGQRGNYDKHAGGATDLGPYDFGSIMHYTSTSFAKDDANGNALTTMEPLDPTGAYPTQGRPCFGASPTNASVMGQRACLSYNDIVSVNALYPFSGGLIGGEAWGNGSYATSIAFGDIDGDGRDEIAVGRYAKSGEPRVFVYDDAKANFAELWRFGAEWGDGNYVTSLAFGNVDADASEELGITRKADENARAWIVQRSSAGAFFPTVLPGTSAWGSGNYASDIAFGNVDGDGRDEIAISRYAGENARFFLLDDALENYRQLAEGGSNWSDTDATSVAFGDVDADGIDELAVGRSLSGSGPRYLILGYNAAARSFTQLATGGDGWGGDSSVTDLAFGQFDGDKAQELAVVRFTDTNARYFVFDDRSSQFRQLLAGGEGWGSGNYATSVAFGDVDRDGRDELAVGRFAREHERFWIIDDAGGSFLSLLGGGNRWGRDAYVTSVALGDVDGDGCDDFGFARRSQPQGATSVAPNDRMRFTVDVNSRCPVGAPTGPFTDVVLPPIDNGQPPPVDPRADTPAPPVADN